MNLSSEGKQEAIKYFYLSSERVKISLRDLHTKMFNWIHYKRKKKVFAIYTLRMKPQNLTFSMLIKILNVFPNLKY